MTQADLLDVPASAPSASRGRRVVGPLVVGLAAVGVVGLLAVVDPSEPGHYPLCPFRALTSLDCPGCGTLRGIHELATGHPVAALDRNALAILLVPVIALAWLAWLRRSWRDDPRPPPHPRWLTRLVLVVVIAWWVVRNIPGVPFLGSGLA